MEATNMKTEKKHNYFLKNIDQNFWDRVKLLAKITNRNIKQTILQALSEMMQKYNI